MGFLYQRVLVGSVGGLMSICDVGCLCTSAVLSPRPSSTSTIQKCEANEWFKSHTSPPPPPAEQLCCAALADFPNENLLKKRKKEDIPNFKRPVMLTLLSFSPPAEAVQRGFCGAAEWGICWLASRNINNIEFSFIRGFSICILLPQQHVNDQNSVCRIPLHGNWCR